MWVVQDLMGKIEAQIDEKKLDDNFDEKWEVVEVKDGVIFANWMHRAMFSEVVEFENGMRWYVMDISEDKVWLLPLWNYSKIKEGMVVSTTWQVLSIWVWKNYVWRALDWLWNPIDGKWEIKPDEMYPIERIATWVIQRKPVSESLETGIKSIDAMVPIWRWQRELIIWDRQTGKTTIAIDTILNQKWKWVYCIYVAIGQKNSKIREILETLTRHNAMEYTIIVNATANDPAVSQYLAPYTWVTLAEYFMFNWDDSLIIYDDLSKHAASYREVSLLLRRPPGREAYPGDVFYLHSKLLERSARIEKEYGGGSITALPIIETQASDVSAYIPTNAISITDGQIFLESDLFNAGIRPAINVGLSVSRVWWAAQTKAMKSVAGKLRLELATFRELAAFAQFASDLDEATQNKIEKWKRLVEMLKQWANNPIPFNEQVVLLYAGINDYFKDLDEKSIWVFEKRLYEKLESSYLWISQDIKKENEISKKSENWIKVLINEVKNEIRGVEDKE